VLKGLQKGINLPAEKMLPSFAGLRECTAAQRGCTCYALCRGGSGRTVGRTGVWPSQNPGPPDGCCPWLPRRRVWQHQVRGASLGF
jgi:hypothetical protein